MEEELYLCFTMGESPMSGHIRFSNKKRYKMREYQCEEIYYYKKRYKKMIDYKKRFFRGMVQFFSQKDDKREVEYYCPKSIDEIVCEKTKNFYVFVKDEKINIYSIDEYRKLIANPYWENPQEHISISYAVSGGWHIGFKELLIKKDSKIDYFI